MIAAVCSWHERHARVLATIERRLDRGARLVVAAHALLETYAVLTRLPPPHRLAPADAWALVNANFVEAAQVVAAESQSYIALLSNLADAGVAGGRSYDALIAATLADLQLEFLTLNPRHFDRVHAGLSIVDAAREGAS